MTEALWRRKPIIGPNHGMIGDLIDRHHLGLSFESENIDDLSEKINLYLDTYKADKEASLGSHGNEYRESLKVERFIESYQNIYQEFLEGSDK
jgi:glycosyltransferase involved in cell wall biosynthesis